MLKIALPEVKSQNSHSEGTEILLKELHMQEPGTGKERQRFSSKTSGKKIH